MFTVNVIFEVMTAISVIIAVLWESDAVRVVEVSYPEDGGDIFANRHKLIPPYSAPRTQQTAALVLRYIAN